MKFVIQYNLMNETTLLKVKGAVEPYPHVYVGIIPFSEELTSNEPLVGTDFIPYGSTLLTKMASNLKWAGIHYDLTKMNYGEFVRNRSDMLNEGVMTVKDACTFLKTVDPKSEWFTRPSKDNKHFSGCVVPADEIWPWFESMMADVGGGSYHIDPDEEVVISIPKELSAEWRWFIVGGKIITGSMYRAYGGPTKLRETDENVIAEAQSIADIWLPHQCVCMDTCLVNGQMKVIEFNCINSSGWYDHDVPAVFKALWEYHAKV